MFQFYALLDSEKKVGNQLKRWPVKLFKFKNECINLIKRGLNYLETPLSREQPRVSNELARNPGYYS